MDNVESIPFSSIIAGMLLCNRRISASQVINVMSKLSCLGIDVDDEYDDIDCLDCCVLCDRCCSFCLLDGFDYDTKLSGNITVFQFLKNIAGDKVLRFIKDDSRYQENCRKCLQVNNFISLEKNDSKLNKKSKTLKRINRFVVAPFLSWIP